VTSRLKRQLPGTDGVASILFKNVLHWKMQTTYSDWPNDNFGLYPKCFDIEEYNWEGVKPSAEAEGQIIKYVAEVGNDYITEEDVKNRTDHRDVLGGHDELAAVPRHGSHHDARPLTRCGGDLRPALRSSDSPVKLISSMAGVLFLRLSCEPSGFLPRMD
jgi:hypothetical protein